MFITKQDITGLIYGEKIDAISREDESKLQDAITYGIEEVASYMNRFDTATLLATADIAEDTGDDLLDPEDFEADGPFEDEGDDPTGDEEPPIPSDDRDPLLKGLVVVCAAWYFIGVANVGVDYAIIQDRYEKAKETLKLIQAGKMSPRNWPAKPADPITGSDPSQLIRSGSNPKRNNHF